MIDSVLESTSISALSTKELGSFIVRKKNIFFFPPIDNFSTLRLLFVAET